MILLSGFVSLETKNASAARGIAGSPDRYGCRFSACWTSVGWEPLRVSSEVSHWKAYRLLTVQYGITPGIGSVIVATKRCVV